MAKHDAKNQAEASHVVMISRAGMKLKRRSLAPFVYERKRDFSFTKFCINFKNKI